MEAVTIAGIAVVLFGGFYSAVDLLSDLELRVGRSHSKTKIDSQPRRRTLPVQGRVKKMTGMHV